MAPSGLTGPGSTSLALARVYTGKRVLAPVSVIQVSAMVCSALRQLDDGDGARRAVDGDDGAVGDGGRGAVDAHDAGDAQLAADDHGVADLRADVDHDGGGGHEQRRPRGIGDGRHEDVARLQAGRIGRVRARRGPGRWPARGSPAPR